MRFSYNFLQDYVDKKLPEPHKLGELLTLHSFEVEGIQKRGQDYILDIDILPNRAHDGASHIGVAREIAVLIGAKLKLKDFPKPKRNKKKIDGLTVAIKNITACPRYTASVIRDVKVKESPAWLRERLGALGINSINNIVDAANYVMLATGQPLHVFDLDKLTGSGQKQIVVRMASQGEIIQTLDNGQYILESSMLVIADSSHALAIAGIKGGKLAEIDSSTKNIIIESANFDPAIIRLASGALGLRTDSSWRFEHEVPIAYAEYGLLYATSLIKELAGGAFDSSIIDTLLKAIPKKIISIRPEFTEKLLGSSVTGKKIEQILTSLGFDVKARRNDLQVTVPQARLDIEQEVDLVEEVARILGYENIKPDMPLVSLYPHKRSIKNYWTRQIKSNLAAFGFSEIYSLSFVSDRAIKLWHVKRDDIWEIANPASRELKYLRPSLLINTLSIAKDNLRFFDEIRIFEIGEIFRKDIKDKEETRLCITIAAKSKNKEYFYELKGVLTQLFNTLGLSDVWFDDALTNKEASSLAFLHPHRRAQIKLGNTTVGFLGQIHPDIVAEEGIDGDVLAADLHMERLIEEAEREQIYSPISNYPQAVRDISIFVPQNIRIGDIMRTINESSGPMLRDVDMFDYYDAELEENLKSIAFHLIFQSSKKTLNSQEIDELMVKITQAIENKGWEVR